MAMKTSFYIETLGCAKNRVDSEIMLGTLLEREFRSTLKPEEADVVIVNTCGFIASAVNESIDRILRLATLKKEGSCKKLVVAGCLSERYRDELMEEIPEIDALLGTGDFTQIFICINNCLEGDERRSYFQKTPSYSNNNPRANRVLSTKQHYAYLKIAEGCSNMCSFCNIPRLRGYFKSRSIEDVNREFGQLLKNGIKEINLISQDSSSYGIDLYDESALLPLVKLLLDSNQQEYWIRIFYSYPNRYPLGLFDLMNMDSRLTPYVDMPFQHISDSVLKSMNRKITEKEIESIIDKAFTSKEDIAIRTTFLVGFPNETDRDFAKLVGFVEKEYFHHIGVFTYSHEDNIASARYGDIVPQEVKDERRNVLMEAQQKVSLKKNEAKIGQNQKVLIEGFYEETDLLLQGRNKYQGVDVDGVVLINDGYSRAGEFEEVEITEAQPYDMIGKIV